MVFGKNWAKVSNHVSNAKSSNFAGVVDKASLLETKKNKIFTGANFSDFIKGPTNNLSQEATALLQIQGNDQVLSKLLQDLKSAKQGKKLVLSHANDQIGTKELAVVCLSREFANEVLDVDTSALQDTSLQATDIEGLNGKNDVGQYEQIGAKSGAEDKTTTYTLKGPTVDNPNYKLEEPGKTAVEFPVTSLEKLTAGIKKAKETLSNIQSPQNRRSIYPRSFFYHKRNQIFFAKAVEAPTEGGPNAEKGFGFGGDNWGGDSSDASSVGDPDVIIELPSPGESTTDVESPFGGFEDMDNEKYFDEDVWGSESNVDEIFDDPFGGSTTDDEGDFPAFNLQTVKAAVVGDGEKGVGIESLFAKESLKRLLHVYCATSVNAIDLITNFSNAENKQSLSDVLEEMKGIQRKDTLVAEVISDIKELKNRTITHKKRRRKGHSNKFREAAAPYMEDSMQDITKTKWVKSEKDSKIQTVKDQLSLFNTDTIATVFNYINANITREEGPLNKAEMQEILRDSNYNDIFKGNSSEA